MTRDILIFFPNRLHLPTLDRPSMQILTSWGIKEGLGRVNGGSSSDFSSFRVSGADHLLFRVAVGLLDSDLVSRDAAGNPILFGNFSSPFSDVIFAPPWSIPFSCSTYLCLLPTRLSFLECFNKMLAESMDWPFLIEPFFRFLSVSDMQTSPTESLEHGKSKSWLVLSGQQDDQPCPNTKKGYSTKTSTLTCRQKIENTDMKFNMLICSFFTCIFSKTDKCISRERVFSFPENKCTAFRLRKR